MISAANGCFVNKKRPINSSSSANPPSFDDLDSPLLPTKQDGTPPKLHRAAIFNVSTGQYDFLH
ncbi:hypothetical protein E4U54_006530, partial [Claviceps lovelessii]